MKNYKKVALLLLCLGTTLLAVGLLKGHASADVLAKSQADISGASYFFLDKYTIISDFKGQHVTFSYDGPGSGGLHYAAPDNGAFCSTGDAPDGIAFFDGRFWDNFPPSAAVPGKVDLDYQ